MNFKVKIKNTVIVLSFLTFSLFGSSQETVDVSGGDISGAGGSASFSVGEVFYTTNFGTNGSVTQGVQIAYEITVASLEDVKGITLDISTFPNPVVDFLRLKIENNITDQLKYQLFDENGRLLDTKNIESAEMVIGMTNYIRATYFLKITNEKGLEIKAFKIVKN